MAYIGDFRRALQRVKDEQKKAEEREAAGYPPKPAPPPITPDTPAASIPPDYFERKVPIVTKQFSDVIEKLPELRTKTRIENDKRLDDFKTAALLIGGGIVAFLVIRYLFRSR